MSSESTSRSLFADVVQLISGIFRAYILYFYRLFVQNSLKSLDKDVVLVTGAGNGIGRLMCLYLGESCPNTTLICWDINDKGNEATVRRLKSMGVQAYGYTIDISKPDEIKKCAAKVRHDVGNVTVIINNAGILHRMDSFLNLSHTDIERTFNVNTLAHCWILKEFLPKMVENNSGHVVTICSVAGHVSTPNLSLYSASKFAVRGLIESVTMELQQQKKNIHFTTVYPGFINTQMLDHVKLNSSPLFPMRTLEPKEAAMGIIDAFRRNEEHVYLPRSGTRFSVFMNNLLLPNATNVSKQMLAVGAIENGSRANRNIPS